MSGQPPAISPAGKSLVVSYRPVADLVPYAKNARTHSDAQVAQIAASIREFGWTNPILVDGENGVVAGHGRLRAAISLGEATVPVIELSGLTAAQRKGAGEVSHSSEHGMRKPDGEIGCWQHAGRVTQDTRIPDSVIRIMRQKGPIGDDIDHPAVFPVALPQFVLDAYSNAGDVVFEPFSGSGTTIIAAEMTGRRCFAMELSPAYVDVAVRRWQQFTGETAVRESGGQPFRGGN